MSKSINFHSSFFFTSLTSPKSFFLNGVSDSEINTSTWDDRLWFWQIFCLLHRQFSSVTTEFVSDTAAGKLHDELRRRVFLIGGNSPLMALL